jgi:hypothetical protein
MINYYICFPDKSIYIGATKKPLDVRVKNHISKWKTGKYQNRKIYQKMSQFDGKFKTGILSTSQEECEMYQKEEGFIALFSGQCLLNNSTGGKISSKGKKVSAATREKIIKSLEDKYYYFEIYEKNSGLLVYSGKSRRQASLNLNYTFAGIWHGLKQAEKNLGQTRKRKNNARFIYVIPGVGYSDQL